MIIFLNLSRNIVYTKQDISQEKDDWTLWLNNEGCDIKTYLKRLNRKTIDYTKNGFMLGCCMRLHF